MKKSIVTIMAALTVLGCQQKGETVKPSDIIPTSRQASYAVSKADAQAGNAAYVKMMQQIDSTNQNPVRAFTVRSEDFLELLDINLESLPKNYHPYVRIYLGYENGNTRLYFTPVENAKLSGDTLSAGKDLYWDGPYQGEPSKSLGDGSGEYLLDFTKPCPTTCPDNEFGLQ